MLVFAILGCGSVDDTPTPAPADVGAETKGDSGDASADSGVDAVADADAAEARPDSDAALDTSDASVTSDATDTSDADGGSFTTSAYFGCTGKFVDRTGGSGTITFVDFAYTPSCMRVKVGQTVTWSGTFAGHPLKGAPTNNPAGGLVPATSTGTSASVAFTLPGYYGYYCDFHGDPAGATGTMSGNVEVVP